ncbi:TIGR04222 domain-containing membrane protein [Spirillospora sp. CA-294931]|uniref:TIGR04222 domain-containing membrane protein n=1 Tax=Spirillospora sp. CA-294931 TaxID=3240042 RepID=UPI003D9189C2
MSTQNVAFVTLTASLVVSCPIAAMWRRFLCRGPALSRELHPYEVACLWSFTDEKRRLLPTVLGALRVDQVLGLAGGRGMRVMGPAQRRLGPLEDAVVAAVAARPDGATLGTIADDERVKSAVDGLRARLREYRLVVTPKTRSYLRLPYLFLMMASTGPCLLYATLAGWSASETEPVTLANAWNFLPLAWWFVTFAWSGMHVLDPEHTTKAADRAVAAIGHKELRKRVRRHKDLPVSAEEAALLIAFGASWVPGIEHEFALRARITVPTGDG